ncbi:hypothetical protein [Niabella aurantiaca]|uniref:hypothetical protein n=1 Tax=Niabella aurantiaca TaxID=379900 RepID=UPI00037A0983|nr:hypothetical protein [Niabella aurantiaca]
MHNQTFTIVDEHGVELLVNADYEVLSGSTEECHGIHSFPASVYVNIKCVELIIAKRGTVITHLLKRDQIEAIEDEIINQLAVAA